MAQQFTHCGKKGREGEGGSARGLSSTTDKMQRSKMGRSEMQEKKKKIKIKKKNTVQPV